jgi:hypothetical protein
MSAATLDTLYQQVLCMWESLHSGDADTVARLLAAHDHDMRQFLRSEAGPSADQAALGGLLRAQQDLEAEMRAIRDRAARQLEASQQSGRASRAYLALAED